MKIHGRGQFNFVPSSYLLPQETSILQEDWNKYNDDKWILKPVLFLNTFLNLKI